MQLSTIRYFYEVSRSRSIRAAAERLHVAPSAVSRQIAQLEDELGQPLLERRARGIHLTPAGQVVQEQFRRILLSVEAVHDHLAELKGNRRGRIRVATVEGAVAHLLSSAMNDLHAAHPQVTFEVTVAGTAAVVDAVINGDADMFIAFNVAPHPEIHVIAESAQPLFVVTGPRHPLRREKSISLRQLANTTVGYLTEAHGIRQLLDAAFKRIGFAPSRSIVSNSLEALKALTQQGLCITIMPRFAAQREVDAGLLHIVPLRERELVSAHVTIGIHSHRHGVPAMLELIASIEDLLGKLPVEC